MGYLNSFDVDRMSTIYGIFNLVIILKKIGSCWGQKEFGMPCDRHHPIHYFSSCRRSYDTTFQLLRLYYTFETFVLGSTTLNNFSTYLLRYDDFNQ